MVKTLSKMFPLGKRAPDFNLLDVCSNKKMSLADLKSDKATVVMFICNHCPYVKHIQPHLVKVSNHYQAKGIHFIAISSNDVLNYPEDGPEAMREEAKNFSYPFPYLFDESQEIAKSYDAACTPDFFVFDNQLACVYRGRFDDSNPGNGIPVTGKDLIRALECILENKPIPTDQHPSLGCNIKWKV